MNRPDWRRKAWIAAVLAAAAGALVYFLLCSDTGFKLRHFNANELADRLRSLGFLAVIIGMFAVLLQTSFVPFAPFIVIAGMNVFVFGLWWGFVINYTMACLGATVSFLFARYAAHDWVERKLSRFPSVAAFNRRLESNAFFYILIGRLIPVIPSSAINLGAGVIRIRIRTFMLATLVGKLPIVLIESMVGHDLHHIRHNRGRLMLLLAVLVLLMALGAWLKKRLAGNRGAV